MFPPSRGFVATPGICRSWSHVPMPVVAYMPVKGDEIVGACDRNSNETVTLRKHFTKYKNMRKWMDEFLTKSEGRGEYLFQFNSHRRIYHLL